ncbi:hypothetical protein DVH24_010051 [Malus domestica]|uniref:Uncharacterized protein n=1 Tax=Malus domestica TaxID=3750 RepID=A0A498JRQ5_MALDO|nr:hypothetical protein DVH24_010051 [Malus domestica]
MTNAPLALSTSTTPGMSAPLIGEPTPFTEAAPTASQVPVSLTSSVSVQPLSARWPHRHHREPEPYDHTSSASRVEGGASQPGKAGEGFVVRNDQGLMVGAGVNNLDGATISIAEALAQGGPSFC